ncbi:uncharacterized protein B0H18DRAFT_1118780 [Fomitopsis serialis]|uniref:uncharacterized protein n=1 Tax=Fomitopsis serialis TaxID=139415 RepID=UPI0020082658|nr:uncharacterized protein B0H18DRAFT_1118780 [Neoantrodia serialis]KAH9926707.1 hypothetical protein B0H18DRAFT_1118780 [Neoantrodia serialis]
MSTTSSQTYIEHRMELLSSLIIDDRSPLPQNHATPPSHNIVTIHCDHFPKLNFLTLRDIGPVARIVNGHSLTSLKLQALLHDTWDELFDLLRSCPALEYLKLASLEAESTAIDDGASHHIVEMRHLRTLTLKDFCEPRGMLSLLAYFALPRTARINVSTYMNAGDIDDEPGGSGETVFAHMFPEDKTSSSVFSDIRSMQIVLSHKCLDLGASTSKVPSADTYSITASCNLVGSQFNPKSIQKQIMLELCTALSTSLKTLHIHVEAHDDYGGGSATESWKSLYTAFPRLEYLYAGGPSISFFADFLRDLGPDLPVQPSPLPWPKLKLIKFANTSTKEDPVESEVLIQSITTSLCNRRDAASGKCLRRLTLVFPEAPPRLETYLGQLRRVTAKLVYTVRGERIVLDNGVPIAG